jgi:hypothetical protein
LAGMHARTGEVEIQHMDMHGSALTGHQEARAWSGN